MSEYVKEIIDYLEGIECKYVTSDFLLQKFPLAKNVVNELRQHIIVTKYDCGLKLIFLKGDIDL